LKRQGLDSTEAIASIARNGIGRMSGYGNKLGEGGDQLVAGWILEQAQNAWIQG
jgi:cytochrome c6